MKKILLVLSVVVLMFSISSCNKEKQQAEKFAGTYTVSSNVSYDPTIKGDGFNTTESGEINIALTGNDGSIIVSGMFNTTGHVDANGVMHLDGEKHVSADLGADVSFLGYPMVGVHFTTDLTHGEVTLNENGTITWTSRGEGIATVSVFPLTVDVNANVVYTNTGVRK
jgi:hypothetical protein